MLTTLIQLTYNTFVVSHETMINTINWILYLINIMIIALIEVEKRYEK